MLKICIDAGEGGAKLTCKGCIHCHAVKLVSALNQRILLSNSCT